MHDRLSRLLTAALVLALLLPAEKVGFVAGGLVARLVRPASAQIVANAGGPLGLHLALVNGTATELPAKLVTWRVDVR